MTGQTYRLKDICDIKSGKRIPLGMDFTTEITNYPYIRARDIKGGKIQTDDLIYIDEIVFNKIKKYIIKSGDIAITIVGASVGDVAYAQKEVDGFNLTENAVRLTEFNNIVDGKYLFYVLNQEQFHEYMQTVAGGAAQPKLGIYKVERIKVLLPQLEIQEKIASILSAYDNLIENNTRRIRLLEQMAENLYKEWFVRFRFPGHEKAEFENGLPKGWKIKRYCDVLSIKYGKGLETTKLLNTGYPVFGSNGQIGYYSTYMYEMPQILISCRGASSGIVNISLPYSFVTNNSLVCEIKNLDENAFEYFKYYFLNTNLIQYQTGSAQPQITIANIEKLKLIIPPTEIQTDFAVIIRQIDSQILNTQLQSNLLSRQRDLLLPRLMSGKLEVNV